MTLLFGLLVSAALAEGPKPASIQRCSDDLGTEVIDAAKVRTLRIETLKGAGSGFFVSPDGFILTAAHVVGEANEVDVYDLQNTKLTGTVLRRDHASDLALVKVDLDNPTPCVVPSSARLGAGKDVFVVGSPVGKALSHSVSKGIVSGYRETDTGLVILQTDASINKGNSGGLVLDEAGAALGVVSFKAVGDGVEGLGFAIAIENVQRRLGISFADASDESIPRWSAGEAVSAALLGMTDRPETPGPLVLPKKCKKVETKVDEFTGASTLQFRTEGAALTWGAESAPMLMVSIYGEPMKQAQWPHTYGAPIQPGPKMQVEIKLEDGTMISYHPETAGWMTNGWFGYWLRLTGPVTPEIVNALGQSRVKAIRAHLSGATPVSQTPRDTKTADEWLERFACAAHQKSND